MVWPNFSFFKNGIHFGATASYTTYSKDLAPNTSAAYRKYYPAGNNFWNVGADYSYTGPVVTFNGETATGGCGAIATINTLSVTPAENFTLMALQRFFGKKYYSMHSSCMSEGGRVQNENGVPEGIDHIRRTFPDEKTTVWCAAIDPGMNEHKYIVPGFGDAGDLCFGDKV